MKFTQLFNHHREKSAPQLSARDILAETFSPQEAEKYFAEAGEIGKRLDDKIGLILSNPNVNASHLARVKLELRRYADVQKYMQDIFAKDYKAQNPAARPEALKRHMQDGIVFLQKMFNLADEILSSLPNSTNEK